MTTPKCPICDASFNDWCTTYHLSLAIKRAKSDREALATREREIHNWIRHDRRAALIISNALAESQHE